MKISSDYFADAAPFAAMADASAEYGPLWKAQRERAIVPADLIHRIEALGSQWHLLVISEDWCIDSQSLIPAVSALADAASNVELRMISRDAAPELMDAHLTNGTSRSIPVVIVLDPDHQERAWWGSRPQALKNLVANDWSQLEKSERNKEVRRWYAIDKGRTTLEEIVSLLERVAARAGLRARRGIQADLQAPAVHVIGQPLHVRELAVGLDRVVPAPARAHKTRAWHAGWPLTGCATTPARRHIESGDNGSAFDPVRSSLE